VSLAEWISEDREVGVEANFRRSTGRTGRKLNKNDSSRRLKCAAIPFTTGS